MFNSETLETWQKAIQFADLVYALTKSFPDDKRFGLTSQMRRAAVSISSNIAEGSDRHSRDDYARFVEIAAGSLLKLSLKVSSQETRAFSMKRIFNPSIQQPRSKAGC